MVHCQKEKLITELFVYRQDLQDHLDFFRGFPEERHEKPIASGDNRVKQLLEVIIGSLGVGRFLNRPLHESPATASCKLMHKREQRFNIKHADCYF